MHRKKHEIYVAIQYIINEKVKKIIMNTYLHHRNIIRIVRMEARACAFAHLLRIQFYIPVLTRTFCGAAKQKNVIILAFIHTQGRHGAATHRIFIHIKQITRLLYWSACVVLALYVYIYARSRNIFSVLINTCGIFLLLLERMHETLLSRDDKTC